MVCETPDLGRIKAVGLFVLDDCMAPVFEEAGGYIDDCPAGIETSDNVDEGTEFTRRCADGSIKRYLPGVSSLQSIQVDVDLHWVGPAWLASAGVATPITQGGEVIGWADGTSDRANILVAVWQEILGGDVCDPDDEGSGCNNFLRLYPLKGARITTNGTLGAEDSTMRLTGQTVDTHALGLGPIELACDPDTGEAVWLDNNLPNGSHRIQFISGPFPEECGAIETTPPPPPPPEFEPEAVVVPDEISEGDLDADGVEITGTGFPPNVTVTLTIDGSTVDSDDTDGSGEVTFAYTSSSLSPGTYPVVLTAGALSASASITVTPDD